MSVFDPEAFLDEETGEALETRFTPIPTDEYRALINSVAKPRVNNNGTVAMDVIWEILDDNVREMMNRDKVTVRQSFWLDIDDGRLAFGPNQNVKLGRLRDLAGQNKSGKPWSPRMLEGAGPFLIQVTQREDKTDSTIIYNDVGRVGAVT